MVRYSFLFFVLSGYLFVYGEKIVHAKSDNHQRSKITYSIRNSGRIKFRGLKRFFKNHNWIAYAPSSVESDTHNPSDDALIKNDLELLRKAGFDGIVTYSANGKVKRVPELARKIGFTGVIMGVWDPEGSEIERALEEAPFVDAYCVGNEGLHNKRYSKESLIDQMQYLRINSKRPVATSETLGIVLSRNHKEVWKNSDWVFVIAHFIFDKPLNSKNPHKGVRWLYHMDRAIQKKLRPGKPVVFKEVGFPTSGEDWASEEAQKIFLKNMSKKTLLYCTFEAFDQPWKRHLSIEPHWGIFTKDREPKVYARGLLDR